MNLIAKLKQRAKQLKSEVQVLMIAYKDRRTPASAKILIGITVGYLLGPKDLIPDFIPVLGFIRSPHNCSCISLSFNKINTIKHTCRSKREAYKFNGNI